MRRDAVEQFARQADLARARREEAGDEVERGRLTASGRAQQPKELPAGHLEVRVSYRPVARGIDAKPPAEALGDEVPCSLGAVDGVAAPTHPLPPPHHHAKFFHPNL